MPSKSTPELRSLAGMRRGALGLKVVFGHHKTNINQSGTEKHAVTLVGNTYKVLVLASKHNISLIEMLYSHGIFKNTQKGTENSQMY